MKHQKGILGCISAVMLVALMGCNDDDSKKGTDSDVDTNSDADTSSDTNTGADSDSADSDTGTITIHWDWNGVVGTGQSLAVGQNSIVTTREQPYNNLKLSTGNLEWPVNAADTTLAMVPLAEPVGRRSTNYPSSWPTNIAGETPHSAMGNQITAMVEAGASTDFVGVHGEFGENGQCMYYLKKNPTVDPDGINGRAFEATLIETQAITRLAQEAGKTYGVGAVILTHGECDAGNVTYEDEMHQLWADYNTDIKAITGQIEDIQMIVSQQHSVNNRSDAALAQWKVGVDYPDSIVCSGPKYQYPYSSDGIHLVADGYRQLGEKYGQVYFERVIKGTDWQPLQPLDATRNGRVITVRFHVPVPPLVFDETLPTPHAGSEKWRNGEGFEVRNVVGMEIAIESVEIDGDSVIITCGEDLPGVAYVNYAMYSDSDTIMSVTDPVSGDELWSGTTRWGRLRDSDPFVGAGTGVPQPNWCVAFELDV
ncbi:MAG: dockerin [Deltaproteobacteria bacterium]|nr:dockerin [Deltaproteobacteria bacterium]MBN2672080.1 dockerin [Deltaproteobacteria bacterium]